MAVARGRRRSSSRPRRRRGRRAVQLQQVWVDPAARGRGYAQPRAARPLPAAARATPCDAVRAQRQRAGDPPLRGDRHAARSLTYRSILFRVRLAFVARHGESEYSAAGLLNGDAAVPVRADTRGRAEQARALGEVLRDDRVDLCVTHRFQRVARDRRRGAARPRVPRLVVPELNDPLVRAVEGGAARRVPRLGRRRRRPADRPGRRREPRRDRRPLRAGSARPARAARGDDRSSSPLAPIAYAARRFRGAAARRRACRSSTLRDALPARRRPEVERFAALAALARAWAARELRVAGRHWRDAPHHGTRAAGCRRCDAAGQSRTSVGGADSSPSSVDASTLHSPARADRARRRGDLPRLRRPRLDLPLHALRELGYRVSALHVDYGLRGERIRRRCALLRGASSAPRSSDHRGARPRPSCATSATPSRPTACVRRATRRRPGRDDPLPPRPERRTEGDQAAARGRRRPPAALAVA